MKILLILSLFVWSGLIIGISFIEAPLKFTAPNITTTLGLGIGRVVFTAMNKVEIILAVLIIVSTVRIPIHTTHWWYIAVPLVCLIVQTYWMYAVLNPRVEAILSDKTVEASSVHLWYVVLEVIKFLSIIITGIILLNKYIK